MTPPQKKQQQTESWKIDGIYINKNYPLIKSFLWIANTTLTEKKKKKKKKQQKENKQQTNSLAKIKNKEACG